MTKDEGDDAATDWVCFAILVVLALVGGINSGAAGEVVQSHEGPIFPNKGGYEVHISGSCGS